MLFELPEQCIPVFFCPLARCRMKFSTSTRVESQSALVPQKSAFVGFDQVWIELVLADDPAEAVADLGAAAIPI
jgi:hypothetical protein